MGSLRNANLSLPFHLAFLLWNRLFQQMFQLQKEPQPEGSSYCHFPNVKNKNRKQTVQITKHKPSYFAHGKHRTLFPSLSLQSTPTGWPMFFNLGLPPKIKKGMEKSRFAGLWLLHRCRVVLLHIQIAPWKENSQSRLLAKGRHTANMCPSFKTTSQPSGHPLLTHPPPIKHI